MISALDDMDDLAARLASGDRAVLARAITWAESTRPDHRAKAEGLLEKLADRTGGADRIGLSGPPGVGKSTTIESFGKLLTGKGKQVAVLAVDPSSTRTGGSILGDKTRMAELAADPRAYIRPSPSAGTLGGVARATRDAMLLCEAAGFDVIVVETVGVGQSETAVADLVDVFVALLQPHAGDELQGVKKGLIEVADILAVNKADGPTLEAAKKAARQVASALELVAPAHPGWPPPVLTISGATGAGLEALWGEIEKHRLVMEKSGARAKRRSEQAVRWMWSQVDDRLRDWLEAQPGVAGALPGIAALVAAGELPPSLGAARLLKAAGLD